MFLDQEANIADLSSYYKDYLLNAVFPPAQCSALPLHVVKTQGWYPLLCLFPRTQNGTLLCTETQ